MDGRDWGDPVLLICGFDLCWLGYLRTDARDEPFGDGVQRADGRADDLCAAVVADGRQQLAV